jgi:hypothetical protein
VLAANLTTVAQRSLQHRILRLADRESRNDLRKIDNMERVGGGSDTMRPSIGHSARTAQCAEGLEIDCDGRWSELQEKLCIGMDSTVLASKS